MTRFTRVIAIFLFVLAGPALLLAQVDRLGTFQSNFSSANLQTKLEILRASAGEDAAAFGPLYAQALSYVVSNAEQLIAEPLLREVAFVAMSRIAEGAHTPALNDAWRLFLLYNETTARIQLLEVLSRIAVDSPQTVDSLNEWLRTQNSLFEAGQRPDLQVVRTALETAGELNDPSSFGPAVGAILVEYPQTVREAALATASSLGGDRVEQAADVVAGLDLVDRVEAYHLLADSGLLDADQVLEFARTILSATLQLRPRGIEQQEAARQIRYAAAATLRQGSYSSATAAVIRHFNQTVLEFDRGQTTRSRVLEAIATLGAMQTSDAAVRLTDYLELLNTYSEIDRPYDTQIVLATIQNLALLGQPSSYNALFFTTLIDNFPTRIRDAAREALTAVSQ